jgi:hypothetical protein
MDPMELLQFLQMQQGGGNQQQQMADALRRSPQMMGQPGASDYPDLQAPQMMGPPPQGVQASMGPISELERTPADWDSMDAIDPELGLPPSKLSNYMTKLGRKAHPSNALALDTGE